MSQRVNVSGEQYIRTLAHYIRTNERRLTFHQNSPPPSGHRRTDSNGNSSLSLGNLWSLSALTNAYWKLPLPLPQTEAPSPANSTSSHQRTIMVTLDHHHLYFLLSKFSEYNLDVGAFESHGELELQPEFNSTDAKDYLETSSISSSNSITSISSAMSSLSLFSAWQGWSVAAHITLQSDVQALIELKNAVEADSIGQASCLGSWNFSVDPCDFRSTNQFVCGIRCDVKTGVKSRVTSIALDRVGYRGYLSPYIGNLTELTELILAGNGFHGSIPQSITGLVKLYRLDLSGNMLSEALPDSLGRLVNLQVLSLGRNRLSGPVPGSLNNLKMLKRLDLSYNALSGMIPPLGGLTQLYNLDLSYNGLVGVIPSPLPASLSQMTLKSNFLTGTLPASLSGLRGLGVLDLSGNRLSGSIDRSLFSNPELQQLNLSNNSFTAISVPNMSGVESLLVAVDIGFNRIGGLLPSNFSTLQSLSALSLRYNGFQGPIPAEYGVKAADGVKPLVRLFLDGNYLNGGVPAQFLRIPAEKISGSFADNCLKSCPSSVILCQGSQKPATVCKRAYGRRVHIP